MENIVDNTDSAMPDPSADQAISLWKLSCENLSLGARQALQPLLAQIHPVALRDDCLVIAVPNSFVKNQIVDRHLDSFLEAIGSCGKTMDLEVLVSDVSEAGATTTDTSPLDRHVVPLSGNASRKTVHVLEQPSSGRAPTLRSPLADTLDPRFTFDDFVIGPSNRFAHAAAMAVAEAPGKAYNPLFIHGGVGLGKTHLLHAIGNYVIQADPTRRAIYVSTETLMTEFVDAIRKSDTTSFKKIYRGCDILLVDDVQFMEGRTGQFHEEFFHTFNALHGAAKQIVITSDRAPRSFHTIEDRLRSRFMSGLLVDVQPPDVETRLAILQKKAEYDRVQVPNDVLELIATRITDNIRELEGALVRLAAYASLDHRPLDLSLAQSVLADFADQNSSRPITPQLIIEHTSQLFGFTQEDICGTNRSRPLVLARQIAMYVCRELTNHSYPSIAKVFGGRDHTTVIHSVDKVTRLMRERRSIYDQVTELIHRIRQDVGADPG